MNEEMMYAEIVFLSAHSAEQASKCSRTGDGSDVEGPPACTHRRISAHEAEDTPNMATICACVEGNSLPYFNWEIQSITSSA
jgi:hypothetical protein